MASKTPITQPDTQLADPKGLSVFLVPHPVFLVPTWGDPVFLVPTPVNLVPTPVVLVPTPVNLVPHPVLLRPSPCLLGLLHSFEL